MLQIPTQARKGRMRLPIALMLAALFVPFAARFAPSIIVTVGTRIRAALVRCLEGSGCGEAFSESVNLFTLDRLLGNCGWVE